MPSLPWAGHYCWHGSCIGLYRGCWHGSCIGNSWHGYCMEVSNYINAMQEVCQVWGVSHIYNTCCINTTLAWAGWDATGGIMYLVFCIPRLSMGGAWGSGALMRIFSHLYNILGKSPYPCHCCTLLVLNSNIHSLRLLCNFHVYNVASLSWMP